MRRRTRFLGLGGLLLMVAACGRSGALELDGLAFPDGFGRDHGTPGGGPSPTPAATQCASTDASLVGCWPLDGSFADGSPLAHVASVTDVDFASGVAGQSGSFDAVSYFNVPSSASFNLTAMTAESWVRLSSLPASGRVTVLERPPTVRVDILPDGALECIFDGDETVSSPPGAVDVASWTHVGCTFDPDDSRRVWVAGLPVAQGGADGGPDTSSSDLRVGSTSGGANDFVGEIDVLRIWNRVLTPTEMCEAAGC